ncbi:MAG: hypothetical protein SynsKO_30630 [Synoicihabitans sp.]
MLHIASSSLRIDLIDPTTDARHLGPRFAGGGYIWQVHDKEAGPLLSGPEGPEPNPEPFNGHGLPESFRDRSRSGEKWLWQDDEALAPGAGTLRREPDGIKLVEPCVWHIDAQPTRLEFSTQHAAAGYEVSLNRDVVIAGRTLQSISRIINIGEKPMQFEWFAHPFFALGPQGDFAVRLPASARIPADSGFTLAAGVLRGARRYIGKDDGAFALLENVASSPLQANVAHPALDGGIAFTTDFPLSECPIWMNGFTFSIEPYQTLELAPGEHREWTLTYQFGESSTP